MVMILVRIMVCLVFKVYGSGLRVLGLELGCGDEYGLGKIRV